MSISGIIAEFNPLHTGHKYLINEAKKLGAVVCVISGNFVQRGDTAIAEKRLRALSALRCGADLVVELPVLWSMSTAQNFALGGVSILKNIGCDTLFFGSECGDIESLKQASDILSGKEFSYLLSENLASKETFARLRQTTAESLGVKKDLLSGANNNLAIEYIIAASKIGFEPSFKTVKRLGALHDSLEEGEFVSASLLREKLRNNDRKFCERYIPQEIMDIYTPENISDIGNIEKAILAVLRTKSADDLKKLPDISEGVENKIFSAIGVAESLSSLYNNVKVKRYTHARIRRLVISAFLGFDNEFFMKEPPYVRVLGFNSKGEEILRSAKKTSNIPIVTTFKEISALRDTSKKVFETEVRATDLFSLSLPKVRACGMEYTSKIIKTE